VVDEKGSTVMEKTVVTGAMVLAQKPSATGYFAEVHSVKKAVERDMSISWFS